MTKDEIISMVNDALDNAYLHCIDGKVDFGAVNWVGVDCTELIGTADGWIAYVECAAPDAEKLITHVKRWLESYGVEDVTVITRW